MSQAAAPQCIDLRIRRSEGWREKQVQAAYILPLVRPGLCCLPQQPRSFPFHYPKSFTELFLIT